MAWIDQVKKIDQQVLALETQKQKAVADLEKHAAEYETLPKSGRENSEEFHPIEFPEGAEVRKLNFEKGKKDFYFTWVNNFDGQPVKAMPYEIISDIRNGIYYDLSNRVVSKDFSKKFNEFRKQYIEYYYNWQIAQLKDQKIIIEKINTLQNSTMIDAYESFLAENRQEQAGIKYEKIVTSVIQKLALVFFKKYGLTFRDTKVDADVEAKIDCMVGVNTKGIAAGVEQVEEGDFKNVQLTLRKPPDPELERKKKWLKEHGERGWDIDAYVLTQVKATSRMVARKWHQWELHGRPPGGPEKFFTVSELVDDVLVQIFEETELNFDKRPEVKADIENLLKKDGYPTIDNDSYND